MVRGRVRKRPETRIPSYLGLVVSSTGGKYGWFKRYW